MKDYEDKLEREKAWHLDENKAQRSHFLNSGVFYSKDRQLFNYASVKMEMARVIEEALAASRLTNPSILIAPIGDGNDLAFVRHLSKDITGIDLSQDGLDNIKDRDVKLVQGDISRMQCFADNQFDVVLAPLFFHHFNQMYDVFVAEMVRVLKPGGFFVTLEPSILHPISWITRSARRVVGNITNQVEDEAPLVPFRLKRALIKNGLVDVRIRGASFSHNRLPVWLAKVNNVLTRPLLSMPVANQLAWMCLFYGRKAQ